MFLVQRYLLYFGRLMMGIGDSHRHQWPVVFGLFILLNVLLAVMGAAASADEMGMTNVAPADAASSMFDEFDQTLNRLNDYTRDRFDSSRRSVDSSDDSPIGGSRISTSSIKKPNRKRLAKRLQSLGNTDDELENDAKTMLQPAMRKNRRGKPGQPQSISGTNTNIMGKVLDVLMPNLAVNSKQTAGDIERRRDNELIEDHEMAEMHPKRFQSFTKHRHQLGPKQQQLTDDGLSRIRNACEICPASLPPVVNSGSYRCCGSDDGHIDGHIVDESSAHYNQDSAISSIRHKTKRQTSNNNNNQNKPSSNINPIKLYRTREISPYSNQPSQSSASFSTDLGYPEIVAKTSALLAPLVHRKAIASAGNPYSDFLNYYDPKKHNLSPRDGNDGPTGEQLTTNMRPTINGSLSSPSSSAPDYGNNTVTTNATTIGLLNNTTSAGETSQGGGSGGGGAGDGVGRDDEPPSECAKYIDASNTSRVLQRVLDELQRIRTFKEGQSVPEGAPCSILGSWNSEIIGLRFDINKTTADTTNASAPPATAAGPHDLVIRLFDHNPPKRNTLMDSNWSTWGYALNYIGGPFSVTASVSKEQLLATFTGICKSCGGVDTIFGTWSIVHPAKDCGDLQTALETKRDIFRREMMFVKKQHRLEQLALANEISTTADDGATTPPPPNENTTRSTETPPPVVGSSHKRIHSADSAVDDYDDNNHHFEYY